MEKLYIDMDGVLCDFDDQCRRYFYADMKDGESTTEYKNRIGSNQFWRQVRETKGRFWSTMKPKDDDIVSVWRNLEAACPHIAILSSPDDRDPYCIPGKNAWLDTHLGPRQLRLFHTNKSDYACPRSILVDDFPKNTEPWKAKGGQAILFKGAFDYQFWDEFNGLLQT